MSGPGGGRDERDERAGERDEGSPGPDAPRERAIRLLQGYLWHPRELEIDLADWLPERLEPSLHVLWDRMPAAPFTFFEDGTLSASQAFYQLTVLAFFEIDEDDDDPDEAAAERAQRLVPWLAETLQARLEATPPGVGWQLLEDLRPLG